MSDGAAVITRRPGAIKRIREPSGPLHPAIAVFMKAREIWVGAVPVAGECCAILHGTDVKIDEN